jgi:cytochrome c oxidase subunit 2
MLEDADLDYGQLRLLETDNRVVLPVGVAVRILVTSGDVLHSFAVPSFAIKADCVPGRLNQIMLLITRPGVFYGQCSELCGVNHGFMPIVVESVSIDDYLLFMSSVFGSK